LAKKIASYYDIDINKLEIEKYEIRKQDILDALQGAGSDEALSSKRLKFNEALLEGASKTLPFTLQAALDTSELFASYHRFKTNDPTVSLTDFFSYAVCKVLVADQKFNSTYSEGKLHSYPSVNLALAIPFDGIVYAPVIKNADEMSVRELAQNRIRLKKALSEQKLTMDDMNGATFTVSNLGQGSVMYFTPIISYPQNAILGIGMTERVPKAVGDNIELRVVTYFSLTLNHFVLDGMDGVRFMDSLALSLSQPCKF
jgi:pyruvate dehydrogenase E2 component (dihydrolipoamide acetyltransferase)